MSNLGGESSPFSGKESKSGLDGNAPEWLSPLS